MRDKLFGIINSVRTNKGQEPFSGLQSETRLRQDLGFDSFDLAELTVRIEQVWKTDVFADGIVFTVGDILQKLERRESAGLP